MFSNPVLDIVIGLIFIYLLYSLLASIVQEIIANFTMLRGATLEYAVKRMLEDGESNHRHLLSSTLGRLAATIFAPLKWLLWDGVYKTLRRVVLDLRRLNRKRGKNKSDQELSEEKREELSPAECFFNMPSIKYLREDKTYNRPSYISAANFSEATLNMLLGGNHPTDTGRIEQIRQNLEKEEIQLLIGHETYMLSLKPETKQQFRNLLNQAQGDYEQFRLNLESWFNDMMDRCKGWYKKKVQGLLFAIGLGMAIGFNLDTIQMAKTLRDDAEIREQLLVMARDYKELSEQVNRYRQESDSGLLNQANRFDTLSREARELYETRIKEVNSLMGLGWEDTIWTTPSSDRRILYSDSLRSADSVLQVLSETIRDTAGQQALNQQSKDSVTKKNAFFKAKLRYEVREPVDPWQAMPGWILTALAISLGAPFWFDLLNKFMSLRGSGKKPEESAPKTADTATGKRRVG